MRTQASRRRSHRASDLAMEGLALDAAALRSLANFDTEEVDSLAEEILVADLPRSRKRKMLGYLKNFYALNRAERAVDRELIAELEALVGTPSGGSTTVQSFTVRGVVDALREPLGTLVAAKGGAPISALDKQRAREIVLDAARVTPREVLLAPSMPHQLGGRRYAELVAAVEAAA